MTDKLRDAAQLALCALERVHHTTDADRIAAADALRAALAEQPAEQEPVAQRWQPIETAPKGRIVLVHYKNSLGNGRTMRARYYLPETLDSDTTESGWADEGWYEESEAYEYLMPLEHDPTHWMPLPAGPDTAPQPANILHEVVSLLEDAVNEHVEGGNEPSEWLDFSQAAIFKARAMLAAAPKAPQPAKPTEQSAERMEPDAYMAYNTKTGERCPFLADDPDLQHAKSFAHINTKALYTTPQPTKPAEQDDDLTIAYMAGQASARRTKPAKREPLTDEEIGKLASTGYNGFAQQALYDFRAFARAIEAAHGITGETI